ncbi:hypothetical protein AAKU52_001942 [Pedobacter sp. CG_S7]
MRNFYFLALYLFSFQSSNGRDKASVYPLNSHDNYFSTLFSGNGLNKSVMKHWRSVWLSSCSIVGDYFIKILAYK